jgi:hypothetical protein
MKKVILAAVGVWAVMGSGLASAIDLQGGTNAVPITDCALLANDINLILSNNVVGSLICDEDSNFAAISLCHSNGQTNSRSAVVTTGTTPCVVSATEDCVVPVTGSSFPSASTEFGTVSPQFPGQACDATNAASIATTLAAGSDAEE